MTENLLKIQTRISNKHDLEANWLEHPSFLPMPGELIIYDVEVDAEGNTLALPSGRTTPYTFARLKIGDGITAVNELPFIDDVINDTTYDLSTSFSSVDSSVAIKLIDSDDNESDPIVIKAGNNVELVQDDTGNIVINAAGVEKTDDGGFVLGDESSRATGAGAVTMGNGVLASGDGAVAMGEKTKAIGDGSLAQGSTIFRSGADYTKYEIIIPAVPKYDNDGNVISDTATVIVYYADPEGEYAKRTKSLDELKEANSSIGPDNSDYSDVIIIAPPAGAVYETWEPVDRYTGEDQLVLTEDGRYAYLKDLRYTEAHGTGSLSSGQGSVAYARSSKSLGYRTQTGVPSSPELAAERPEAIVYPIHFKEFTYPEEVISGLFPEYTITENSILGETGYGVDFTRDISPALSGLFQMSARFLLEGTMQIVISSIGEYDSDNVQNILYEYSFDGASEVRNLDIKCNIPSHSKKLVLHFSATSGYSIDNIIINLYPKDNYGQDTIAIGADTAAIYNQAFAGGWKSIAHSHASLAFGTSAITKGDSAISLGMETEAEGITSVALAHRAKAKGVRSVAIGLNPEGKEGEPKYETIANGSMSICAATHSTTNGSMSAIIGGYGNTTNPGTSYSATLGGVNLTTDRAAQVTIGKNNKPDTDALFVIGNGTVDKPSNAFAVLENGKLVNGNAMLALDDVYRTIAAYPRYVEKTTANLASGTFPVLIYNSTESIAGRKFQIVFDSIENEQAYSGLNLSVTAYTDSSCVTKVGTNIDPTGCYITVPKDRTNAKTLRIILPKGIFLKNNGFDTSVQVAICEVTEHNFLMNRKLREQLLAGKLYSLEEFDEVENTYVTIPHSHWYGKKCVAFGTSVTNKLISGKPLIGRYIDHLAWYFGFNLSNYGVGSKGVTTTDSGTLIEIEKFVKTEEAKTTDLIIIEVGANDVGTVWNGKGGTVTDLYDPEDETSNNTYCGRLNYCLKLLQENTRAQIVVFSSPYSQSEKDTNDTYTWSPYELVKQIYKTNNLTEECCKFNNVPYLILQTGLGFRRLDSDTNNMYVREDISGGPDIHPTELGAQILAESMVDRIRQIPLFPKA